jgi:hypothetical protein
MNTTLFFAIIFCFYCKPNLGKTVLFTVTNNTIKVIDSIKISGPGFVLTSANMQPNYKIEKKVTFTYPTAYEGAFIMSVYKDTIVKQTSFGYFENSNAIKNSYNLEIFSDLSIREK